MLFILLVLVVASALVPTIDRPASTGAPVPSATTAEASRLQSATDAVDSATTAARAAIASLPGFPTTANVSAVINPYINSLQLYDNFLSDTTVPAATQSTAQVAQTQVRQDVRFLESIDGLPALRLGAFLQQFGTNAAQLQSTLSTLEQGLHSTSTG